MSMQPVMLVGVGEVGVLALHSLRDFHRLGHGEAATQATPYLTLDFATHPAHSAIPHYELRPTSLLEWKSLASSWRTQADYNDWFDGDYYLRLMSQDQPGWHRQWVRLLFLKELNEPTYPLQAFFAEALQPLIHQPYRGKYIVHVLCGLNDTITRGILIDLINFIHWSFAQEGQSAQVILHLGLPQENVPEPLKAANFAFLRELQRFGSYGHRRHVLYDPNGEYGRYNAGHSPLIDLVNVYAAADSISQSQQEADTLILLLDPDEDHFSQYYRQQHITNWPAIHSAVRAKYNDNYRMVVSAFYTQSALFPQGQLEALWQAQVGLSVIADWAHPPSTVPYQTIDQGVEQLFGTFAVDGTPPTLPDFIGQLIQCGKRQQVPTTLDALEGLLYTVDASTDALLNEIVLEQQSVLHWQAPYSTAEKQPDGATWGRKLYALLNEQINLIFAKPVTGQSVAQYDLALNRIIQRQSAKAQVALYTLLEDVLNSPFYHPKEVYTLLERALTYLKRAMGLLAQTRQQQLTSIQRNGLIAQLSVDAEYIPQVYVLFFKKLTPKANRYRQDIQSAWESGAIYKLLDAAWQIANLFIGTLQQVVNDLMGWSTLLTASQAILRKHLQAHPAATFAATPTRYWLADTHWQNNMYAILSAKWLQQVRDVWRWQVNMPDARITCHWETANLPIAAIQPLPPFGLTQGGSALESAAFVATVTQLIQQLMASSPLRLREDYLLAQERYRLAIPELQRFFASPPSLVIDESNATREFVLLPYSLRFDQSPSLQGLPDKLFPKHNASRSTFTLSDTTRIARLIYFEGVLLDQLPFYAPFRAAYQRLGVNERRRLHIYGAESRAVYWEARLTKSRGQMLLFPGSIMALIDSSEVFLLYLRLEAAGFIKSGLGIDNQYYSQLLYDDHVYWLVVPQPMIPSRLTMAQNFLLGCNAPGLDYGNNRRLTQTIDPVEAEAAFTKWVQAAKPNPTNPMVLDDTQAHWRWFKSFPEGTLLSQRAWGLAYEADVLFQYMDQLRQPPLYSNADEETFNPLVLAFVQEYYDKIVSRLRERLL